jgi:hypothetical protein
LIILTQSCKSLDHCRFIIPYRLNWGEISMQKIDSVSQEDSVCSSRLPPRYLNGGIRHTQQLNISWTAWCWKEKCIDMFQNWYRSINRSSKKGETGSWIDYSNNKIIFWLSCNNVLIISSLKMKRMRLKTVSYKIVHEQKTNF